MSDDDIRDLLSRRDIERVEADPDDEARHWPNSRRQTRKP